MSFLGFCFSSNWERERESGIQNLGIKEKWPKVTYLIFRWGSTGESFFFHGLTDFILFFYTGLKNLGSLVSQIFFCLQPGILAMVRLPRAVLKKLTFLLSISADGGRRLPFWGPSQSFGFSLPPLSVSGDLRLLSTNTCWYPLCDLHSLLTVTFLTGFHCSFQREDSINLTSIVSAGYRVTIPSWLPVRSSLITCPHEGSGSTNSRHQLCRRWCSCCLHRKIFAAYFLLYRRREDYKLPYITIGKTVFKADPQFSNRLAKASSV